VGNKSNTTMPTPLQKLARQNRPKYKPGSLQYDLQETKRDIRGVKRGMTGEASLEEMQEAKKRIKGEIKAVDQEEIDAMVKDGADEDDLAPYRRQRRLRRP
jgi:hypothetical protein